MKQLAELRESGLAVRDRAAEVEVTEIHLNSPLDIILSLGPMAEHAALGAGAFSLPFAAIKLLNRWQEYLDKRRAGDLEASLVEVVGAKLKVDKDGKSGATLEDVQQAMNLLGALRRIQELDAAGNVVDSSSDGK